MSIKITSTFDANLVRAAGSDRYLLFKINGENGHRSVRAPLNLSLIIDRSGSMSSENKLELVKKAAMFVVERLTDQDRVNVIAYDDEINILSKSVKATSSNRARVKDAIAQLHTGGSTNLSEGWLTGCREIAEFQTEARYIDCAWLLTDGLANVGITDQEELTRHARELHQRQISTTTFGVGTDFNEDLLRALSEKGGGHFYFIDSSKQIQNYFEGELGERLQTLGRNLALQVKLPEGVSLDCLNDYELTRGKDRAIIHLGDISAGEEKLVLLKLTFPEGKTGQKAALSAFLMYTDAISGDGKETTAGDGLAVTYTTEEEARRQTVSTEMKEIIGKMLAARTKQEVLQANRAGKYDAVQPLMDKLQHEAEQAGVADAFQVQEELRQTQAFGSAAAAAPLPASVAKKVHYETHLQQRSRKDYKKEE